MNRFSGYSRYIALGDSVSIDLYPALDLGLTDVAVALERETGAGKVAPVGAASLLFQNSEEHWPDEMGDDLASLNPGIAFQNLASDGATIGDVFGEQLAEVEASDESTLVTLTIGTTDLFSALGNKPKRALLDKIESDIAEAYDFLVDTIRGKLDGGLLIVNTIYDPSDRSGRIPGVHEEIGPLPLAVVDRLNDHIRAVAVGTPRVVLADLYAHFLGHGTSAAEADRWYWRRSLIEPNAAGANEIRKVWRSVIEAQR